MKYTHLRPDWWRPGDCSGSGGDQNGVALMISNQPYQATTAVSLIFAIKAIRPATMASGINIKDSWIADSCSDIHIGNNIKKFVQYKEIEPFQI